MVGRGAWQASRGEERPTTAAVGAVGREEEGTWKDRVWFGWRCCSQQQEERGR